MTMLDTVREMQARYLEGMKSAQEQLVTYNERIAGTVVASMPDWQSPFSEYLPKPTELVDTYFGYLGDLYEANRDFATQIAKAWDRSEAADA
jgi:hypothetical protein